VEAPRRKLIVVSNRAPVSYGRDADGERLARRGGGGLVTALRPLVSRHDVTWIASAMTDEDGVVAAENGGAAFDETGRDGAPYRLRLVAHDPGEFDRYYNVFANPMLWFIQHHLWDLAHAPSHDPQLHEAWAYYASVNEGFAKAVVEELDEEPDAAVWFHDYHLYLAPRTVRRARPRAALAHFVHIPWPDADGWTVLPEEMRRSIHEGLLSSDVVGFHTRRWRDNFLGSVRAILGAAVDADECTVESDGRRTLITAHPISVDVEEFDELATSPAVLAEGRNLELPRRERMILRVDRTDPSKNIVRGFIAYEKLLRYHPELKGKVQFWAFLQPSRQDVTAYARYTRQIRQTAARINS